MNVEQDLGNAKKESLQFMIHSMQHLYFPTDIIEDEAFSIII